MNLKFVKRSVPQFVIKVGHASLDFSLNFNVSSEIIFEN